jgi:hypothetical protein
LLSSRGLASRERELTSPAKTRQVIMALWNKVELLIFGLIIAFWWWRGHRRAAQSESDELDEYDEGGPSG